nr:MAG TPA: hypothetical protein [Caudoviricetes sp.]
MPILLQVIKRVPLSANPSTNWPAVNVSCLLSKLLFRELPSHVTMGAEVTLWIN